MLNNLVRFKQTGTANPTVIGEIGGGVSSHIGVASIVRSSIGKYLVTINDGVLEDVASLTGDTLFKSAIFGNLLSDSAAFAIKCTSTDINTFTIWSYDAAGALADIAGHFFVSINVDY